MSGRDVNVAELKQHLKSTGQTFERVGKGLCGLTDGCGEGHNQPCPICGGTNRFWYGAEYDCFCCRRCPTNGGKYKSWDAIALVGQKRNVDFKEAVRLIAEVTDYVGNSGQRTADHSRKEPDKPIPSLDTFRLDADSPIFKATAKHRPDILFEDYQRAGAKLFRDPIPRTAGSPLSESRPLFAYLKNVTVSLV